MKTIYLTETQSFELIRLDAYPRPCAPYVRSIDELPSCACGIRDIRPLLAQSTSLACLDAPYQVFVPTKNDRRPSKLVACRTPPRVHGGIDVVSIDECCTCLSPGMAYTLLCNGRTLAERALMGLELCGSYLMAPESYPKIATRYGFAQLTTAAELASAANRFADPVVSVDARMALRYVLDGSASPMESALVLLLCLPIDEGGYGLPLPELNADLPIVAYLGQYREDATRYGDLVYRDAKLVVEYQSDLYHEGDSSKEDDEDRRDDIEADGYTVMFITPRRMADFERFEGIVQRIAHHLGISASKLPLGPSESKLRLRKMLLPASWSA